MLPLVGLLILLTFFPPLAFLGPWDKSDELYKYIALALPLSLYPFLEKTHKADQSRNEIWVTICLLTALSVFFVFRNQSQFIPFFFNPVETDIGQSTLDAVIALFKGQNPYSSEITYSYNLGIDYAGFKYGPGMLLSYAPLAILPLWGLKLINLFYLLIFSIFSVRLIHDKNEPSLVNVRNFTAFICSIISLNVLWVELFKRGVVDIAPVCFVVIALYCIKNNNLFLAGVFAALSISCKPSIGLAVTFIILAQYYSTKTIAGILIGTLPWIVFLIWDSSGLIRNTIYFHLLKSGDTSTVYHYLSLKIKPWFSIYISSLILFSILYKRNEKSWQRLLFTSCTTLALSMILFRHIHNNHSLWIFPFIPLLLTDKLFVKSSNNAA